MLGLHRAGIVEAVISPGSRSTPWVLAAEHVGMRTRTIIDERSAGFFALGRARTTGVPPVLICTSGTAGAHYYPAVIEASSSFVPLIVVTADRPAELHGCAALQTIDQTRLYGAYARWFADLGAPHGAAMGLRAVARKAAQAVATALGPIPGPVHVNAPARKPLEPAAPASAGDLAVAERADRIAGTLGSRMHRARSRADRALIESLAMACDGARSGVIVTGPLAPASAGHAAAVIAEAIENLARATGFPVLCEASGQLRFGRGSRGTGWPDTTPGQARPDDRLGDDGLVVVDGFDWLLASGAFRRAAQPDLILQVGAPPSSMSWQRFAADNRDCVWAVIAEHGWNDPHGAADLLIAADVVDAVERLAREVRGVRQPRPAEDTRAPWTRGFAAANHLAWRCVERILARPPSPRPDGPELAVMSEGQAMRAAVAGVPSGAFLTLGNGLPVRTVDSYCRAGNRGLTVLFQRGANGIDGLLSATAGAAGGSVAGVHGTISRGAPDRSRAPSVAILGDVSFAHDAGGLAVCARSDAPVVIVVIDNQGGRIFELLPIARTTYGTSDELFARHWLTPAVGSIEGLCAAYGVTYARPDGASELETMVAEAAERGGCTVVHAVVEPSSAARDREAVTAALDDSLEQLLRGETDSHRDPDTNTNTNTDTEPDAEDRRRADLIAFLSLAFSQDDRA